MDKLELFFIKRYLKTPKRNLFRFSFVFMVLGIVLSVGILSAGLNLFQGYESNLKSLLLDSFAHIGIQSSYGDLISEQDSATIINQLSRKAEIISAIPSLEYPLLAQKGDKIRAINLRAYDFSLEFPYQKYINEGAIKLQSGEVIVGHYLAEELGLGLGDDIELNYPRFDRITPLGLQTAQNRYKIAALYRSGYYESDRSLVISTLDDARALMLLPQGYSKIELRLKDADKAGFFAREYSEDLGQNFIALPWNLYAESLLRLVAMEKWLIFIVFSFLVLIAGINVISAVSTIIIDKRSEIAVLKTLGASPRTIKRLFALRVGVVAILSVLIGQVFGVLLSWFVEKQSFYRLKGDVYFIDTLGAKITFPNLLIVFLVASFLIFLCVLFPLRQIQKMQIIEVIRHKH
ncbi:MAG: ABC transporter permease [Candidatus Cloacimonetes bacterium]|jgi:lipoprotein-releasing system permease protein|nr:ABC transporter permease [Candidatus Cloacimonadota bacterium]MCK9583469.1 ABC transporter permease [Candidatus Cloacimonadota bacterium]MDY0229845.1 ABC transporter permease [Candidatus Cloacimonadaceae bacterium]